MRAVFPVTLLRGIFQQITAKPINAYLFGGGVDASSLAGT